LGARGRQFKSARPDFVRFFLLAFVIVALAATRTGGAAPIDVASRDVLAFRAEIARIGPAQAKRMTGVSWRRGCPVALRDLRLVTVSRRGFDGKPHTGRVVVNRDVAQDVVSVFRVLYAAGFPIRRMVPIDAYGGSDFRSIEADNTSGFNCRFVGGTARWSEHAYGRAIDVNPIENPYVSGARTSHRASRPFVDRRRKRPGMALEGGLLVRAFDRVGWGWGGRWFPATDYQHFSASEN
jgi:D-alanyl-D-alanine carboxypeptidase